jgi:hypothetical protein
MVIPLAHILHAKFLVPVAPEKVSHLILKIFSDKTFEGRVGYLLDNGARGRLRGWR